MSLLPARLPLARSQSLRVTSQLPVIVWGILLVSSAVVWAQPAPDFEIEVIDSQTGRGVPLVELVTVHDVRYITDNAGRVAYGEPGHAGQTIYFHVEAHGYEVPKDGFGFSGVRLKIEPGGKTQVALKRINRAERLYRITGQDLYRDSLKLGYDTPLQHPHGTGLVAGQDSVQMARFRGRLYWFWGDTNRLSYPLGLFRTAGATSPAGTEAAIQIEQGLNLQYFTGADGFARAMVDVPEQEGVVWIDGVSTVRDSVGEAQLVAHYSRRKGLAEELDQGVLKYNVDREIFEVVQKYDAAETWAHLADHPIRIEVEGTPYLTWGNPFPLVRVRARLADILDRSRYEAFSCLADPADPASPPRRDEAGALLWTWQHARPTTQADEFRWLKAGLISPAEARFLPANAEQPEQRILMHGGTVRWNEYLRKYVMLAVQNGFQQQAASPLGEVWLSAADSPQGPYETAIKVVTHRGMTFYNPCHHHLFDVAGGRQIYFEGTYCNTFTTLPPTQRYNYNQIMYKLDLEQPEIKRLWSP